MTITCRFSCT